MKNIGSILSTLAVLLASAGVFFNAHVSFATIYYRACDSQFGVQGANCCIVVMQCDESAGPQCSAVFTTTVGGVTAPRTYYISKKVDGGNCVIATRTR